MRIERTDSFKKDYQGLPEEIKERTERAIQLLLTNPRHPSLRAKKVQGTRGIWEASVTLKYRMTFEWEEEVLRLRQVGTYDILKTP
jgi:mRNA interferase RelE/StbE